MQDMSKRTYNLRIEADRLRLTADVYEALANTKKSGPMDMGELQAALSVGQVPLRKALATLIEEGSVGKQGKTRLTTYYRAKKRPRSAAV